MTCKARQHSDQMYCDKCGIGWDMNDIEPPVCGEKIKMTFTHKGWLGVAPIYMDESGQNIMERSFLFMPLLSFSIWFVQFINDGFDCEYPFPIRVTRKLKNPVVILKEVMPSA